MKPKTWKHRLCAALAGLLLVCALLPATVFAYGAIDTAAPSSLTLAYQHSDVTFRLYRVANVSASGRFTLAGDFLHYQDLQQKLDAAAWDDLVLTLEARVIRDQIEPLAQGVTDNHGTLTFSNLSTGLYLVLGDPYRIGDTVYTPEPFLVSLPNLDGDNQWVYDVTSLPKPDSEPGKDITVKVQKVWDDDGNEDQRPQSITVQLFRDGAVYDTVTLDKDNNWRYTWTGLSVDHHWVVAESGVPAGYDDAYSRSGHSHVIVNTYEELPPETPTTPDDSLPQTGLLLWPIPLLVIGGLALFLIGWHKYRKQGETNEEEGET